jgi:LysR family nitrogen assimilation transcriptional regulator
MKASKRLHVAQPALSVHLSNLELELGVSLVTRGRRGITLTEDGALLYERALPLLRDFQDVMSTVKSRSHQPKGLVSVGLTTTLPAIVSTPLFRLVRRELPEVKLYIADASSALLYQWLHEGNIDMAVLYSLPESGYLDLTPLFIEDFCLVGPPRPDLASPDIDFKDIFSFPLATSCRSTAWRKILDDLAERVGKQLDLVLETESYSTLRALAISGECYALLPRLCVHQDVVDGRLSARKIVNPDVRGLMSLANLTNRPLSLAARKVKELAVQVFRDLRYDLHLPESAPAAAHLMQIAPSTQFPIPTPPSLLKITH